MRISKFPLLALFVVVRCLAVPVSFEERSPGHFLARFANGAAEFRPDRVILWDVSLRFLGAADSARLEGVGPAAPSTYLRGGFVRTFQQFPRLAIHNLYPGVDAVFYGTGENLEYDLRIATGVSPGRIRISLEGAHAVRVDDAGNLTIETASGVLRQMRPRVFQQDREISARYVLLARNKVGIRLGKHSRRLPLTVDPVLSYTKYFGASGSNLAIAIATDIQGNIYVAGQSNSAGFPTTSGGFEPNIAPILQVLSNGGTTVSPLQLGVTGSVSVVAGTPDGRILYAATSAGIMLSGDGGATWRQTAPFPVSSTTNSSRQVSVYNIALDPLDPATILVSTNVGLFGSDSGGEFWGQRDTGLPVSATGSVWATSVFYSPVNPLIAYATTANPSYLFASADAGNTWRPLHPTYPSEPPAPTDPYPPVAATLSPDGTTLYAVDGNGVLLKTTDGGTTWVRLGQGLYGPITIQLDPSNPSTLYVFDQLGLQKSIDGGLTFSTVTTPITVREFAVDSSGTIYVGGTNLVYFSTDGGNTFAQVPNLASYDTTALSAVGGNVYVGSSSPSVPFVIKVDPTGSNVLYSTFLGGSDGDGVASVAVDAQGNAVLAGYASSPDFPFTVQPANPPTPNKQDAFVAKLSADGTRLIYSIGLGGSKSAAIRAVALDSSGSAFVTGQTFSADFPTTEGVLQPTVPAIPCPRPPANLPTLPVNAANYAFVTKIAADGSSLVYSTFLTGSCGSSGMGIAPDAAGSVLVVGSTTSPDFPVSPGSYQSAFPGPTIQVSPPATFDAGFATKLSPAGEKLVAGTYLGGGYATQANAVTVDAAGNAYITGFTQGIAPGATPGAYRTAVVDNCAPTINIGPSLPYTGTGDAFVLKLDATLSSAQFLTYFGGGCNDSGSSIALDAAGDVWISGSTSSSDFPLKDPFQAGGVVTSPTPGFVTELSANASQLLFSTLSDGTALAVSATATYLAGATGNSAFVAKIDPATTPTVEIDSVSPITGYPMAILEPFIPGVAVGQLIQISGNNLGPATKVSGQLDASGRLPFVLSNTIVFFDDVPAPLISLQASSIMCFVPFEVASTPRISVSVNGQRSNAVRIGVASSSPQVLSVANPDGSINSSAHPAKAGSMITLYVSGLGQTNPPSADGLTNAAPLPVPLVPVTVYSAGNQIVPQSVTAAPGMIAGITQINIQLPAAGSAAAATGIGINVNSAGATVYVTP